MTHRFLFAVVTVTCVLTATSPKSNAQAKAPKRFNAYAAPNAWGEWVELTGSIGANVYKVSYTAATDNTRVVGQVEYWANAAADSPTRKEFLDDVRFRTADVVGKVRVRFRGVPFGSAVTVWGARAMPQP